MGRMEKQAPLPADSSPPSAPRIHSARWLVCVYATPLLDADGDGYDDTVIIGGAYDLFPEDPIFTPPHRYLLRICYH